MVLNCLPDGAELLSKWCWAACADELVVFKNVVHAFTLAVNMPKCLIQPCLNNDNRLTGELTTIQLPSQLLGFKNIENHVQYMVPPLQLMSIIAEPSFNHTRTMITC